MKDSKTEAVAQIIRDSHGVAIERLLVVGCGSGTEAAILAQELGTRVVGIDIVENFDSEAADIATLQFGNAMEMDFDDCTFDYVYSYHALEHIPDPSLALREMSRVLRTDGGFWIGTPNRSRIVGYVGSKDATLRQKLSWNIDDWKARLGGKFSNELGAHAGFSSAELRQMLGSVFSRVEEISDTYFSKVYERHKRPLRLLRTTGLERIAYPSIYFIGRK